MAVTWQSQPNSARSTTSRRRRLTSGPAGHEAAPAAPVAAPTPLLRPPVTPYYARLRRRSTGYRVASVDVVALTTDRGAAGIGRRKSYALFSPYVPLPAIGDKKEQMEEERPRFLRERTYSVIEPVFVRGPQWAHPPTRTNNDAWSRHATAASRPLSPHLPNPRRPSTRRLSTPEMLDDVQLPPDLDLDEDIFSEDLGPPKIGSKRSEGSQPSTIDLNEVEGNSSEQRNSKLVDEVTDSLKRLWTRL